MKKNSLIKTNIAAIKLIHKQQPLYIPSIILTAIFSNLSPYITIIMSANILNELASTRNLNTLLLLVSITILADFIVIIISSYLGKFCEYKKQCFAKSEMQMFNNYILNMDYEHMENADIQNHRKKIDEDKYINSFGIWALINSIIFVSNDIINIIISIILSIGLFSIVLHSQSFAQIIFFSIILLILFSLSIYISIKNAKKMAVAGNELSNSFLQTNKIMSGYDVYSTGKDIRLYNLKKFYLDYQNLMYKTTRKNFANYSNVQKYSNLKSNIISQLINTTIYIFVCLNALKGLFLVGDVLKYIGIINRLMASITSLSLNYGMFKMNFPFLQHYLEFFEIPNKMYHGTLTIEKRTDNDYEIEFINVSFKYPNSEIYAIKNLNLKFNIGQKMAVVGMNGSGKTTMIKLLCRLYDPTEGEITLNGINIKNYNYFEYLSIFSVVFQDFKLFSFSLGQNIASSIDFDSASSITSLEKSGLKERFANMPAGLDTPLYKDFDEDGIEISGGEAQKIAIARALYKNAPFIILDEPTSALDPIAEFEIYSNFNTIVGDKTAIYISHRLSSCRFCDDIVVFDNGELIQRGNHNTLITNQNGKYFELWNAQAKYYNENNINIKL